MLLFVLRIIWPSILNVILRLCLLMYAVRTFLCSWRNLWQLSVASLFIQIISPMIPAYDWDSLWEKPAWRIVGNQRNLKYINHQYIRSRSYRWIFFSNNFLAPRFDFITINCFTKPCFRRWCLDDTLDFWGVCERLRRVEIKPQELNLVIQLAFSFKSYC